MIPPFLRKILSDVSFYDDVPLYDEDGNEILDDDFFWNAVPDETDPDDETDDWQYDDSDLNVSYEQSSEEEALQDDRPAEERRKRIAQGTPGHGVGFPFADDGGKVSVLAQTD